MRALGLAVDPNSGDGGSTLDLLLDAGPVEFATPTLWVPLTTGQADKGYSNTDRNDEARGTFAKAAPVPDKATPSFTFTCRLYDPLAKYILPRVLPAIGSTSGTVPAAVTTPLRPTADGQLPALHAVLIRDEQVDQFAGVWFEQVVVKFAEGDPTIDVTARALYHQTDEAGDLDPFEPDFSDLGDPYAGVTLTAKTGAGGGTRIACLGTFDLTFNNGFETDPDVVYCRGENVLTTTVSGKYKRRQYPGRHIVGDRDITGNLSFGTVRPDMEDRLLLSTAERLVVTAFGNPLGTTPAADAALSFEMPNFVATDGGADDLARSGPIKSSYQYGGFVDDTSGDDLIVRFVDTAAITLS